MLDKQETQYHQLALDTHLALLHSTMNISYIRNICGISYDYDT